jgi:hypothetical protein
MATDSKTLFDVAMELQASDTPNVRQAVPFFNVKDIEASLRFYGTGSGSDPIKTNVRADPVATAPGSDTEAARLCDSK